ncbi:MAG TPA: DUF3147 family protein [Candidatus Saccharimonadales bacterium]|nr:DUF3147 family protein [Candidatus Saccharimonadales bacterium]
MISAFEIYLVVAFFVGGLVVTLATVLAEKLGSKAGGFITGLPSTIVISLLFIGITQSPLAASQVTTTIPAFYAVFLIFISVFCMLAKKGFAFGLITAFVVWITLAVAVVVLDPSSFILALALYLVTCVFAYYVVRKKAKLEHSRGARIQYSASQLLLRSVFAGAFVALAVFSAHAGGIIFGSLFAVFPSVTIPTLVIVRMARNTEFARAVAGSLMTSAMVNVMAYAILVRYLYPWIGLWFGTVAALLLSGVCAYSMYGLLARAENGRWA